VDIVLSLIILSILILMSYERKFQVIQRWLDRYRTGYYAWINRCRVQRFKVKSTPTRRSQSPASPELQNQLVQLFDGDRQQAERFVAKIRSSLQGKSEAYYWSLALQRKRCVSPIPVTSSNASQIIKPPKKYLRPAQPTKANPQLTFLSRESSKYSTSQTQKIKLHLEAASDLVKQHKIDLALPILNRLIREYPGCLQARLIRGRALRELGKYDAAITDFDYVIQQEPNHTAAHRDRGLIEYDQRNYLAAIASLSIVIGHLPSAKLFEIRGNAYKGLGQNDSAIRDYLSAKKIYARQGAKSQVRQLEKQIEILYSLLKPIKPVYLPKNSVKFPFWQRPAKEKQPFLFEQGRAMDQKCLLQLLYGDRQKAERLLELARSQHPNRSIHWYFEKALYDLKRDRS